jgi:hypothetical protein
MPKTITEDELYARIIKIQPKLSKFDKQTVLERIYTRKPELKNIISKPASISDTDFTVSTGASSPVQGIQPTAISGISEEPTMRDIASKVANVLPAVGATAGAVLAGIPGAVTVPFTGGASLPATLPIMAAGAGFGGSAGEAGRQLIRRAIGEQTPTTSMEAVKDIGVSGLESATLEGVGGMAIGEIGKGLKPFSKYLKPAYEKIKEIASKAGVKLLPSEVSTNPWLRKAEEVLSNTWLGFDNIWQFKNAQKEAVDNVVKGLSQKYGTKMSKEEIYSNVERVLADNSKRQNEIASEIYKKRDSLLPKGANIRINNTLKTIQPLNRLEQSMSSGLQDPELLKISQGFMKEGTPDSVTRMNFDSASKTISRLNDKIAQERAISMQGGLSKTAGQLTDKGRNLIAIRNALQKDVDNFLKTQPKEARALNTLAKKTWREFSETFRADEIRTLSDKDPMAIVNYVIAPNRIKEFDAIKRAVGIKGIQPIKERFFQDVLDKTAIESGAKTGTISAKAIDNMFERYSPDIVNRVLSKQEVKELKNLSTLINTLENKGQKQKLTALSHVIGIGTGASAYIGGIPVAAGVTVAPYVLSKFYTSELGRKLLTEGLTIPADKLVKLNYGRRVGQFLANYGITASNSLSPQEIKAKYKSGELDKATAADMLRTHHGFK